MTTQTADPVLQTADYILSRLTSWFGNRPDYFSAFIDGNIRAEGWLPAEAYYALSGPVSRQSAKVAMVRGKAQGSSKFDPDLELDINRESHQLAVVPVLTSPDEPLVQQIENNLSEVFEWLTGSLSSRTMLYLLAFPSGTQSEEWSNAVAKAEEKYNAKPVGQMQFVIPRPPREMVRAAAGVFVEASRVPQPER